MASQNCRSRRTDKLRQHDSPQRWRLHRKLCLHRECFHSNSHLAPMRWRCLDRALKGINVPILEFRAVSCWDFFARQVISANPPHDQKSHHGSGTAIAKSCQAKRTFGRAKPDSNGTEEFVFLSFHTLFLNIYNIYNVSKKTYHIWIHPVSVWFWLLLCDSSVAVAHLLIVSVALANLRNTTSELPSQRETSHLNFAAPGRKNMFFDTAPPL